MALIPAAGTASRLPGITCSKEMLEVAAFPGDARMPALQYLLNNLSEAGLTQATIITSPQKTDVLDYIKSHTSYSPAIITELISESPSVPHTLLCARQHYAGRDILFTLPDILYWPKKPFATLLDRWSSGRGDVLLGAFPADRPEKVDIVEAKRDHAVTRIRVKDMSIVGGYAWIMAVWKPVFSDFMTKWLENRPAARHEPQLGEIFNDAIDSGIDIRVLYFPDGRFIDIGTPEDLTRIQRHGLVSLQN
jgi:glucose-1-phosphate thymidylyltransferase